MDLQQETDLLRRVPMFAKLEPSKLKLLAFTAQSLTFDDGEIIFEAGDSADAAYVIMSGEIEILAHTDAGEVVAGVLGPNELFGELAVLNNAPRSATLRARGKVVALRISKEMFLKMLAENPDLALEVMRQLSHKLTRTHHHVEELQREVQRLRDGP